MSKMARAVISRAGVFLALLTGVPANGQVINEDLKLLPSDGGSSEVFGRSIDIKNGIVAVGTWASGSAYIFNAQSGAQGNFLIPNDGMGASSWFGYNAIAIDNNIVAVGASRDTVNGFASGSVYIFNILTGQQLYKFTPNDGLSWDEFGNTLDIENGILAVGSHSDDNGDLSGAVYVYDVSTRLLLHKILPDDGEFADSFGYSSIALSDGKIAIGAFGDSITGNASGSVYLYDALTGVMLRKIFPSDGEEFDLFGASVGMAGGVIVVGAWGDDDNGSNSGSAYLFDANSGQQIAKLVPKDGSVDDQFGRSVAIDNGIVVVGAMRDDDSGETSGSAYLFDANTGLQIVKLLASDGDAGDFFSLSVAIDGQQVAVGSPQDDDNGNTSGSAYLFNLFQDCNGNGQYDMVEIALDSSLDCNLNSILDMCEISSGIELDCNNNGILDSCDIKNGLDPDCNGNGLLDSCEISNLTEFDLNTNAILDSCEIIDGSENDCNGNGFIDSWEISIGIVSDCDNNGIPDNCDVASGFDCNGNGIPDSCDIASGLESDCNSNGIPDSCDVVSGLDCNGNGIPDSCDIASGLEIDCNGNGIPDDCDINSGFELDCNGNGIPDSCDVTSGFDCNGNGIPDSCDIQLDPSLDCDANGAIDTCEIPGILADTGLQGPIGFGQPLVLTVSNMPNASADISVRVTLSGDFAAQTQVGLFSVNGQPLDVALLPNGEPFFVGADLAFDCAPAPTIFEFTVPAELYNSGQINGEATFEIFAPTPGVSIEACPDGVSRIEIQYFYEDAPNDCNGNGTPDLCDLIIFGGDSADENFNFIPDECEGVVCLADMNSDGVLNFFDVSVFLQGFGNNDPVADFTGDGVWNFFDVSAFLQAFSAGCP